MVLSSLALASRLAVCQARCPVLSKQPSGWSFRFLVVAQRAVMLVLSTGWCCGVTKKMGRLSLALEEGEELRCRRVPGRAGSGHHVGAGTPDWGSVDTCPTLMGNPRHQAVH